MTASELFEAISKTVAITTRNRDKVIANKLRLAEEITSSFKKVQSNFAKERDRHYHEVAKLDGELKGVQSRCAHIKSDDMCVICNFSFDSEQPGYDG